jgi:hypothetical protein
VSKFTVEEVKRLPTLEVKKGDKASSFTMLGFWGDNWYWFGGKCYYTVQHRGQAKKVHHKSAPFYNED